MVRMIATLGGFVDRPKMNPAPRPRQSHVGCIGSDLIFAPDEFLSSGKIVLPVFVGVRTEARRTNGYFVDLNDPRADRGNNHLLIDMVGLVRCGRKWAGLKTIGRMDRKRVLSDGTEQFETFDFISSLAPRVRPLARHLREHWSIENT